MRLARANRVVLVTGATGAVGPAVVKALQDDGWTVRAFVRAPCTLPGIESVLGDMRDPASLQLAARNADAVVHMAGLLHIVDAGPALAADFRATNVDGTRALVAAAEGKPFVFFSSITVYGDGGPFDETSPVHPPNEYARTKLEAERYVLAAGGTVLRLAAVYGSRMKGNYATLARAIRKGRFLPIGPGSNHRTIVHESDVARATVLVLGNERARGQIYNVTDGTTHSLQAIIAAMREAVGRRPEPLFRIPLVAARLLAFAVPQFRRLLDKYVEEIRVEGAKLQRDLGYSPRTDFRDTWQEAVRNLW